MVYITIGMIRFELRSELIFSTYEFSLNCKTNFGMHRMINISIITVNI